MVERCFACSAVVETTDQSYFNLLVFEVILLTTYLTD